MTAFKTVSTDYTVVEYCEKMRRNELIVNRDYQRGDEVWPPVARSFLIESILLGYPIPKISIWSSTDVATRLTKNEIIDGQQRSKAILDFYEGNFAIAKKSDVLEARGKKYEELPGDLKQNFLSFRLSADIFLGAAEREIRELFRRINSYTVTLNPEEQRHATYQGEMKWFIYHLCRKLEGSLEKFGVLKKKQFARMQDAKLLADVVYALVNGIKTTKREQLDELYRDNDQAFPNQDALTTRFVKAFDYVQKLPDIADTEIVKPHNFYALVLAIMHAESKIPALKGVAPGGRGLAGAALAQANLRKLNGILEADSAPARYKSFYEAAESKTNTSANRQTRFKMFYRAVSKS